MPNRATIELLGPFQLRRENGSLAPVPQAHRRIVLAGLALAGARGMSSDLLLSAIWGTEAPRSARKTLQGYIARLRRLLGPDSILTLPEGYRLNPECFEADSDLAAFYLSAARDSASADDRLRLLGCGLGLFRGEPLEDVPSALLDHTHGAALRDLWMRALEEWAREQIRVDPPGAVDPLRTACARQPHRESLWALLVEALAASERRAEALESYQRARRTLLDDLGIEPGRGLREAQARALESPTVPRRLASSRFACHAEQVAARLQGCLARGAAIAITGPPGAGKSRIAAAAAAALLPVTGPPGPVFVSTLSPDGSEVPPTAMAAIILRGWTPGLAVDQRASLTDAWARHQTVIVLDDVSDAGQYEWLLPVPPHCALIVCTTMAGRAVMGLDVFEAPPYALSEMLDLLAQAGPAQVPGLTSPVAATLDRVLEGLPAAVHSLAARLAAEPGLDMAEVAARLQDPHRRLDELRSRSIDVRAHLERAYNRLSAHGRRAFRLLGWLNSHSLTDAVTAAALQLPDAETRELVAEMSRLGLVHHAVSGSQSRHRITHLARSLAREISEYTDDPAAREEAVRRALRAWYSRAGSAADLSAGPHAWADTAGARPLMRP